MRVRLGTTRGRQETALFLPGAFPSRPTTAASWTQSRQTYFFPAFTLRLSDRGTETEKGVGPGRSFIRKRPVMDRWVESHAGSSWEGQNPKGALRVGCC